MYMYRQGEPKGYEEEKKARKERNTSCSFSSKPQNGLIDLSPGNSFVFHVQISRSIVAKEEEEIYPEVIDSFLSAYKNKKTKSKENVSTVQPEKERHTHTHPCAILSEDK